MNSLQRAYLISQLKAVNHQPSSFFAFVFCNRYSDLYKYLKLGTLRFSKRYRQFNALYCDDLRTPIKMYDVTSFSLHPPLLP